MQNESSCPWKSWRKTLSFLTDELLLERTVQHADSEREQTAWLVAHLAEVLRRDLALKRGYPTVFRYAREELGLTDAMAWERISAAQLALELPEILGKLASGELKLGTAAELWKNLREKPQPAPAATESPKADAFAFQAEAFQETPRPQPQAMPVNQAEKRELLSRLFGKTRKESEAVIQDWKEARSGEPKEEASPPPRPHGGRKPHGKHWNELTVYLSDQELVYWDKLRDLLSHRLGSMDSNAAFLWLLDQGLEKLDPVRQQARAEQRQQKREEKRKSEAKDEAKDEAVSPPTADAQAQAELGLEREDQDQNEQKSDAVSLEKNDAKQQLKSSPRLWIAASKRRRAWLRGQSRCQFRDPQSGRQCCATAFLDIDHITPLSEGGDNSEENLRLACALHNRRRPFWKPSEQPLRPGESPQAQAQV